jgi:hypothetical protein
MTSPLEGLGFEIFGIETRHFAGDQHADRREPHDDEGQGPVEEAMKTKVKRIAMIPS